MNDSEILELCEIGTLINLIKVYINEQLETIENLYLTKKEISIYIIQHSETFDDNKLKVVSKIRKKASGDYKIISLRDHDLFKIQYDLDKKLEENFNEFRKVFRNKKISMNLPEYFTINAKKNNSIFCNCDYFSEVNYLKFTIKISDPNNSKLSFVREKK